MRSGCRGISVILMFLLVVVIFSNSLFVNQRFTLSSSTTELARTKVMVSAASAYASGEDSNGSISMVPSSLNFTATHVGQTLNLTVWVNDSSNVGAWQVRVEFDDSVINLTDCKELENDSQYIFAGKTTNAWGVTPDVIYVHDASGKGHVLVAAALVPTPPAQQPSSGTGTLCALTFEILSLPQVGQQLTLPLHINTTDTYLLDSNGAEIENVTIYDGTVQIESRALGIQLLSPENETYSTNSVTLTLRLAGRLRGLVTVWMGRQT